MDGRHEADRSRWWELGRPSVVVLVVANLVPLVGVMAWGWTVFPLLLLFWIENLILGAFNVVKMLAAAPSPPLGWVVKLLLVPFFAFHYGMFCLVHGVLVIGLFGGGFRAGAPFPEAGAVLELVRAERLGWAVVALAVSHAVSLAVNYFGAREYRQADLKVLMSQPYGRVAVVHLALLLGGFLMLALRSPAAGLVLLVLMKTGLDVRAHLRERRRFAAAPPSETAFWTRVAGAPNRGPEPG
jgi:hypothetical protein